jgi:hypothetical protein
MKVGKHGELVGAIYAHGKREFGDVWALEKMHEDKIQAAIQQLNNLREGLREIRALVDEQAEDERIWFLVETAPEGYLQQQLRKLHALIEDVAERNDLK